MAKRGKNALRILHAAGHEAYLVGGCVRDMLLRDMAGGSAGREDTEDIDVTTSAAPEEVKLAFSGMRVIETGIRHGTVTVMLPEGDRLLPVEITTYRTERGYADGRHPDSVAFTSSLEEDLKRRDFTMNAIAMDENGEIVDPFGGREDVRDGVIRAVGDPDLRFSEDGLRIMRAMRFAAVLGFDIEENTEQAMLRNRLMLERISAERVFAEFKKLVAGRYAGDVMRRYTEVLGAVFPELLAMKGFEQHNEYHRYDVLEHCVRAMEAVRTTPENNTYMRMAALFHDVGKPLTYSQEDCGRGHFYGHASRGAEVMEKIMERMKADRWLTDRMVSLVRHHDLIFEKDERLLKRWMRRFTPEGLSEILEIKLADNIATGNMSEELGDKFREIREMIEEILRQEDCFSLKDLAVDGKDVMEAGVSRGPEVGRILDELLDDVIDGRVANERKTLLAQIEKKRSL